MKENKEMSVKYSAEKNTQILVSLLKQHGIRYIVVSPGATNVSFVASVQSDSYFNLISSVDERSAAYIACGLAAESGEPVVLSCTGATASRNYVPGLTEAYYRKLPVIAVTATQHEGRIGNMVPQVIDRTEQMNDLVKLSVQCPMVRTSEDEWACTVKVNRALSALVRGGGGPVHINLATDYSNEFVPELPKARKIDIIGHGDSLPPVQTRSVAIYVGNHRPWSERLEKAVEAFCAKYNGAVLIDHTSGYKGKWAVMCNLPLVSGKIVGTLRYPDLLIHIGEVAGGYPGISPKNVWRISPDGEIRDYFKSLTKVFAMDEADFFEAYASADDWSEELSPYCKEWKAEYGRMFGKLPESIPFSNVWIARVTAGLVPDGSALHLGILNTLRSWNFFNTRSSVLGYCNTGGFGIDGCLSSCLGASLANRDKLYFMVMGDLAFFYDMNSIGNRHVGPNLRVLLVNNGVGTEFKNYNHRAAQFGDDADAFMAARGHYGRQSRDLVRHYASDLGFEYLCASNKEEYLEVVGKFVDPEIRDRPIFLEVFTNSEDER